MAVNVPPPPPPMMTAQKVETERLENKLGGRNNSVRIATTSTPNASPLPFQFNEDNEDDMPPTPQNLNFHTPQMAFHSDEQSNNNNNNNNKIHNEKRERRSRTYRSRYLPRP